MSERFKVGTFKNKERRLRRDPNNPYSLSKMPTRAELEDFLQGIFYSSDTVYSAGKGRFEKRDKKK